MLEAQQNNLGDNDFWAMQPALLPIDAGAIRARRVMERLIAAERGDQPAPARTIAITPVAVASRVVA
jgi:vanillate O-demethylase monooxygenase subunit